jgi:hypothetical protein
MSIKLINNAPQDLPMIELRLKGSGEAVVSLFDSRGNSLLTKRWVISGSGDLEVRSRLPLSLRTKAGQIPVIPVLIHQTDSRQTITFDGKRPADATSNRGRAIGLSKASRRKIETASQLAAARVQSRRSLQDPI